MKFEAIEEFQGEQCAKLTGSMDITGETPPLPARRVWEWGWRGISSSIARWKTWWI